MKGELITSLDQLPSIEDEWRRLAERQGSAFTSPEWVRAWCATAGAGTALRIVAVRREDGALAGVLPLVADRAGRRATLRFAGSALGDRFGPLAEPEDEEAVATATIAALEAAGEAPGAIILHRVDADRSWPQAIAAGSSRSMISIAQSPADLLYIPTAGLDWDGYLATRSQKFRQRVARGLEKALAKEHSFSVRETANGAELERDLATLFRLHDLRHTTDSSIAGGGDRVFLAEFAGLALARGWLRLRTLEIEGEPVAAFFAWKVGPRYALYQSGFDPAWADRSVGALLLVRTVRAGLEEGADEVDLLLGEEAYKQRFADATRPVHTVTIVPRWSRARLLVSGEAAARRRMRGLAAHPRIGGALKRAARLLPTGRRG